MVERILELSIYVISTVLVGLVAFVVYRELRKKFFISKERRTKERINTFIQKWVKGARSDRASDHLAQQKIGDFSQITPIFFELFNTRSDNQQVAYQDLYRGLGIQSYLRQVLKESTDSVEKESAVLKMGKMATPEDLQFLMDLYREKDLQESLKECCEQSICKMAETLLETVESVKDMPNLIQLLEIPDERLREKISLLISKDPHSIEDMIPKLMHLKSDSAKVGILTIFKLWDRRDLSPFIYPFTGDLNAGVRRQAIQTLGHWKDEKALMLIMKHIDDPDVAVRMESIEALIQFPEKKLVHEALINRLGDPVFEVQVKIFLILASQGVEAILPILIQRLKDKAFCKKFYAYLSSVKEKNIESLFQFVGIDKALFDKHFALIRYEKCYDAIEMTAKESQSVALRKRALYALSLWGGENIKRILLDVSKNDPQEDIREYADELTKEGLGGDKKRKKTSD